MCRAEIRLGFLQIFPKACSLFHSKSFPSLASLFLVSLPVIVCKTLVTANHQIQIGTPDLQIIVHCQGQPRQTWKLKLKQIPWRDAHCKFVLHGLFRLLSSTSQNHLPRGGPDYSGLDYPASLINQENALQANLMETFPLLGFPILYSLFIILTKPNQHQNNSR